MKTTQRISVAASLAATMALAISAPAWAAKQGDVLTPADPTPKDFQRLVDSAYAKYKDLKDGKNADYIPILTETPSDLFGVVIVTKDGKVYSAGDVDYKFSIQSVSKPFTAALVMSQQGPEVVRQKIGVEPTGLPFNSKMALELYKARSVNPLVNAGAIAAVSLVQATSETGPLEQGAAEHQRLRWPAPDRAREGLRFRVHARRSATARSRTCSTTTSASTATRRKPCGSTRGSAPSGSAPRTSA